MNRKLIVIENTNLDTFKTDVETEMNDSDKQVYEIHNAMNGDTYIAFLYYLDLS